MRSDIEAAILGMYDSIERAREAQAAAGHSDQGARQGITSGKHLDPIAAIIRDDLINAGFHPDEVYDQGRMCTGAADIFLEIITQPFLGFDGIVPGSSNQATV